MKAVRLYAYGDVDQFRYEEMPTPVPGPGEVLVRVMASGFNHVETRVRQGLLKQMYALELPAILGSDIAGVVEAVGQGVTTYAPGDRVIGKLPINGRGAYAEYAIAAPAQLAKLPANVSFAAGATLPLAGLTARKAINALGVTPGEPVVVGGALGAVGRAAVQYLRELGAVPVAFVRPEQLTQAQALTGEAIAVGGGQEQSFAKGIDAAGRELVAHTLRLVSDGGTLAVVNAVPDGANPGDRVKLVRGGPQDDPAILQAVADAAGRGDLLIPVARSFPLAQVGEAHKLAASGRVGGKIVFTH